MNSGQKAQERSKRSNVKLLVRIIALSFFARLTTFHKLFREAGSSPVLGSSM